MSDLVNTFGGQQGFGGGILQRNDDGSTSVINVSSVFETGLNYFGQTYTSLFVNNNGNITFGSSTGQFTPVGLGEAYRGLPIIAPYFADVDTRGAASGVTTFTAANTEAGLRATATTYNGHDAFAVTWPGVGYFSGQTNKLNSFQLILTDRSDVGAGNFDIIFNYAQIQWESGSASGGSNGLGGTSAAAGYSNGTGAPGSYFQLPGSLQNGALLDGGSQALTRNSNVNVAGQYVFAVRNGQVTPGPTEEGPTLPPGPRASVTFDLGGMPPGREGDVGATPYTFIIGRTGDLREGSTVDWAVGIDDPTDLVPGQALSGTVTFAPNQEQASVTILVQGDNLFEQDEIFEFRLTSATHSGITFDPGLAGTAIVLNDDLPNTFRFGEPLMMREGMTDSTPFAFELTRAGDLTRAVTVSYKLDLRETNAEDFAPDQAKEGVVSFAPGQARATIFINVAGDTRVETDELFGLTLTEAKIGTTIARLQGVGTTATIVDDDDRRSLLVASNSNLVKAEGDSGTTAFNFNLTRVGDLTKAANLTYTINLPASGGVSAGEIAGPLTGTVSFAEGAMDAQITVLVTGDTTAEENETFLINLGGTGGFNALTLTGVVMNDDGGAGGVAPRTSPSAPSDGSDTSDFMQHLVGGGLWGDGGI